METRKKVVVSITTGVMAVLVVLGALAYRVAAQSPTPMPGAGTMQQQSAPPAPGAGHGQRGGPGAYSDADLAKALGITTDQLKAAVQSANSAALKEAVSKGLITQAQADQMAANNMDGRRLDRFGRPGDSTNSLDYESLLAYVLGITTDQLQAAYQTAENTALDNAVKNGTMTQAQADLIRGREALAKDSKYQAAMKTAQEAAIQQAVSDGVITQAQADAILQNLSQPGGLVDPGFRRGHGGPVPDRGAGAPLSAAPTQTN